MAAAGWLIKGCCSHCRPHRHALPRTPHRVARAAVRVLLDRRVPRLLHVQTHPAPLRVSLPSSSAAFIGYLVFSLITPAAFEGFFWLLEKGLMPVPGAPASLTVTAYIVLAIVGGIAVGLIGVLLGGCPLRQVVMTAEGNIKSLCFVIGMCIGAVVFAAWVSGWGVALLKAVGIA